MGLESIWNEELNLLRNRKEGFTARSTGCGCCSTSLDTEKQVKRETVESLMWVMRAAYYFKWDQSTLEKDAKNLWQKYVKEYKEEK